MAMTTYECVICLNINHASKLHCSTCGAVPAMYSVLGVPCAEHEHHIGSPLVDGQFYPDAWTIRYFVPVVIARGADRAEHHRTVRTYLRTVKADYYAQA